MITKGMLTSNTDEWSTPQWLFNEWDKKYHFNLDVCASAYNTKCKIYFNEHTDGLFQAWWGTIWMNPPYGRDIIKWVRKAYRASENGSNVVCLLPARTDTKWFHEYCLRGKVTFLRGRIKFGGSKHNAPFPSMIVEFTEK